MVRTEAHRQMVRTEAHRSMAGFILDTRHAHDSSQNGDFSELRSCVKVEMAVLGSPFL